MTPDARSSRIHVVGRDEELSRLDAFLDGLVDGPAAALVLEGASGIGKTTLWQRGVATADERGWRVLSVRSAEAEVTLSFAGLADLLEGARDLFGLLPEPQLAALDVALLRAEPVGPPPDPRAVYSAVLTILREASTRGPVLVALDDVQWLDASTGAALDFALRRLDEEPIAWLVTVRGTSPAPLDIARAFPAERATRLAVEPLSVDELAELLRVRLGAGFSPPMLTGVHETSGGNPFFALEIARATLRGDSRVTGMALPIPRNLRDDLVRDRLGALTPLASEMLLYASACSRPSVALLETALERASLEASVAEATDAGLVESIGGQISFTHPLYRSAIYANGSRAHRHRVHRRMSAVVVDDEERARHLALAADGPDEGAATSLEQAATSARARGATVAAADLCELAERLTPPGRVADVRRLLSAAAEYRVLAGDYDRAISLLGSVTSTAPPGPERAEALLRLGQALGVRDDQRRAADVLTQALDEDGTAPSVLSAIHTWRSYAAASLGDLVGAQADAEEAHRLAGSTRDPEVLAEALVALVTVQVWRGEGIDHALIDRAVELEGSFEPRSVARRPTFGLASLQARTGEIEASRSLCTALLIDANDAGDEDAVGLLRSELGWVEFLAGDWERSREHLTRTIGIAPGRAGRLAALAGLEAGLGDVSAARLHATDALDVSLQSGAVDAEILARAALGSVELSMGAAAAAHDHLDRAWQLLGNAGFGEPAMFPFVADHVLALVALGKLDAASDVVAWLEERGHALERPWALAVAARSRGMLAAARGDVPAALEAMTGALEEHERLPMPFELARTLMALGTIRRRAKQKRPAREALDEAVRIFRGLGASLWVEQCHAELARIGGRRAVVGELTAAERRVARLAAAGRTNREIADTLFMSVRTVEGHLSHIYGKLGIRSRTELALFVDAADDPSHS